MIEYNIGILGAGHIAGVIAETLKRMNGFCPYAIASRDPERAKEFAEKYEIEKCYDSYDELLADPDVELVYIATVNSTHVELAKKALDAGKPVFVEKPFSYNSVTAKELLDYAAERELYCGEAMWLRFNPLMISLADQIKKGLIGDPRTIVANIGYNLAGIERILKPELGGGAILDIGIYPFVAIFMLMGGTPTQVTSDPPLVTNTGVDVYSTVYMKYPQGRSAIAITTAMSKMDNTLTVYGTHGHLVIDNVNNPTKVTVYGPDGNPKMELTPENKDYNGYEYEFKAAREAAIVGKLENKENTRSMILGLYQFTDILRKIWNTVFPLPGEPEKKPMPQGGPQGGPPTGPQGGPGPQSGPTGPNGDPTQKA